MFDVRSEAYFIYLESIRLFQFFFFQSVRKVWRSFSVRIRMAHACAAVWLGVADEFRSKQDNNNNSNNNDNDKLVLWKFLRNFEEYQRMNDDVIGVATIFFPFFFVNRASMNDVMQFWIFLIPIITLFSNSNYKYPLRTKGHFAIYGRPQRCIPSPLFSPSL